MVLSCESVPFSISIGLDLSYNEEYSYDMAFEYITNLQQSNIDYIVSTISIKDQEARRNFYNREKRKTRENININEENPLFINDFQMKFPYWKNKFISKIHDEDLTDIRKNFDIISQDLNYANYINSKSSSLEISDLNKIFSLNKAEILDEKENTVFVSSDLQYNFCLVKLIRQFFAENVGRHLSLFLNFTKDNYFLYSKLQSQINHFDNFEVILKIDDELPDELWCCQNVRALLLPLSLFKLNNHGYPVLKINHQKYLKYFMRYGIDIIIRDDKNFISLSEINEIEDYTLYLKHLFLNHFEYRDHNFVLNDYLDVFQIPLQPLKDNLQSQTYECFEDDIAKYDLYEKALLRAFNKFKETGYLQIEKLKEVEKGNTKIIESRKNKTLNVCLVGAGRGPIMRRIILASISSGININPILVEKNKNAYNTLLHLKKNEPNIFGNVKMYFGDMRNMQFEFKMDIIVSELLGSFGDNELSPECLKDIEKNLDDDGIMIPYSYTSYIRPVSYPINWFNVRKLRLNYENPLLVLFHRAFFPIEETCKVFHFSHPQKSDISFNQEKSINFRFKENQIIHGFAGYFESVLYDNIKMSILPNKVSDDMHYSWFPIYFPSLEPIEIRKDEMVQINIERVNDGKRIWYQWNFSLWNDKNILSKTYPLQNLFGDNYTINL